MIRSSLNYINVWWGLSINVGRSLTVNITHLPINGNEAYLREKLLLSKFTQPILTKFGKNSLWIIPVLNSMRLVWIISKMATITKYRKFLTWSNPPFFKPNCLLFLSFYKLSWFSVKYHNEIYNCHCLTKVCLLWWVIQTKASL